MTIISIVLVLVIVGVALYLLRLIPMASPMPQIITALVVLAVVLWLLENVGLFQGFGHPVRFR